MVSAGFDSVKFYRVSDEGFVVMGNNLKFNKIKDLRNNKFDKLKREHLMIIDQSKFNHNYKKELINSVFKPTILNFKDVSNKF